MALVGKGGVGRHQYLDILTSTLFVASIYKTYGALTRTENFCPPVSRHPLARKTSVSPSRRPKSCAYRYRSPASCVTAS